jgi:drug/metabolite transporter (DMT)-like permease
MILTGSAALVLLAAAMHATWNALLKGSGDRLLSLTVMIGAGCILGIALLPFVPTPADAAWKYLLLGGLIHVGYYTMLLHAYSHGDLSLVYPIARGTGPLWVALASGPLIHEWLSLPEVAGTVLISLGVAWLAWVPRRDAALPGRNRRAVFFALATGVFIASYSVADGLGVRASQHPLSYIVWMNICEAVPLLIFTCVRRRSQLIEFARVEGWRAALGGLIAAAGYAIVVWAYSRGTIAPVAALRETSVVLAAFIGTRLMGEPFGRRRQLAAVLVAAGAFLLAF